MPRSRHAEPEPLASIYRRQSPPSPSAMAPLSPAAVVSAHGSGKGCAAFPVGGSFARPVGGAAPVGASDAASASYSPAQPDEVMAPVEPPNQRKKLPAVRRVKNGGVLGKLIAPGIPKIRTQMSDADLRAVANIRRKKRDRKDKAGAARASIASPDCIQILEETACAWCRSTS